MRSHRWASPGPSTTGVSPARALSAWSRSAETALASTDRRVAEATRVAPQVRIGTSGWQYADWREVLYPKGLPQRAWRRELVPPGFVIAAKLSRYLTHVRGLRDPVGPVQLFMDRASHLGPHLGPVVMQLPPTRARDEDGLERTLNVFPAHLHIAVEFRHPSWFVDRVGDILHSHNASLVWADRGGRLQNPDWITADWLYLRLHGGRGRAGNYGHRVIDACAQRLSNLGRDAYVYFNNDTGGNAVRNALALKERLQSG